jgi:acyl-coenzyme A synthetase/AMP-(fatty) acid ligase
VAIHCIALRQGQLTNQPDHVAIKNDDQRVTYKRLNQMVDEAALNLRQISIAQICTANDGQFGPPGAVGKQPVMLVQSSGTTGKAKSFLITHEQCMHKYTPVEGGDYYLPSDRFMSLAAMCFHFTRTYFFRLLFSGATLVLGRFADIEQRVRIINEKSITIIQATAYDVVELLAFAEGRDEILFPHHPQLVSGTAPVSPQKRLEARSKITSDIRETYGSNETGSVTRYLPEDQDNYPDSVGKITSLLEMRIVDTEGRELPVGEAGSICFRGPGVTTGYIDNQEMDAKHFHDGWFFPGDVGRINKEGYLFLLGRDDDVINNAGVKFYPIEVEKILRQPKPPGHKKPLLAKPAKLQSTIGHQ